MIADLLRHTAIQQICNNVPLFAKDHDSFTQDLIFFWRKGVSRFSCLQDCLVLGKTMSCWSSRHWHALCNFVPLLHQMRVFCPVSNRRSAVASSFVHAPSLNVGESCKSYHYLHAIPKRSMEKFLDLRASCHARNLLHACRRISTLAACVM